MRESGFGTFFVPGPTEVRREVLEAMTKPMIPHRSTAFESLFATLQSGLKGIFQTSRPVYVTSSSATGLMEAAVRCVPPGRILCLVNGAFSERFARIAEQCGRDIDRYEVAWGDVHEPLVLREFLARSKYRAITVVHSETSTGALNPIRSISDAAHEAGVLCLIDSVSGVGGAELRFDEWGLDYVLTGSQKALALPPGLAFAVASPEMVSLAHQAPARGVYFDIVEMEEYLQQGQVPSTPSISLFYALEMQLQSIEAEGIETRWGRHGKMAALTQEWLATMNRGSHGWRNIAPVGSQSPTVSTIQLPESIPGSAFVEAVAALGIRVGGGYGKLRDTTFRIGHMGDHDVSTVGRCLDACERASAV